MVKSQNNNTIHLVLLLLSIILSGTINSMAQDCIYTGKGNNIVPRSKCAPVDVDWTVTYVGVEEKGTGNVQIQYDWDDGNPVEIVEATLSNSSTKEWTAVLSHTYPNTGNQCNYYPRATIIINGVVCTSAVQEQMVTVWDTDDRNGGELSVDPAVYPICVGNGALFHFTDVSQWNCTPPDEEDFVNNENRWIQWIYGTGGTTITDAQVDGEVKSYPWSGEIEYVPGPVEGPISPYNTSLDITIPDYYPVGAFFEVTLRNWNTCNPYDETPYDGTPPSDPLNGDYPPVTTTARAIIVALPDASVNAVPVICESEDPFYLVPQQSGGIWSGDGITDASTGLFDPGEAGPGTHTIYYSLTDVNNCSDVGSVDITIMAAPQASINQNSYTNLCPGVTLNLNGSPTGGLEPYTHLWKGDTNPLSNTTISDPTFSTTTIGQYEIIYHVEDSNSCWDEDTISIDVEDINITLQNNDLQICKGDTILLDPSPSGGSDIYTSHVWSGERNDLLSSTDIQSPYFYATETGVFKYSYSVTDTYGCSDSDSITITVYDKPISDAGKDMEECALQTTLEAFPSIGNGYWKVIESSGNLTFQDSTSATSQITADTYGSYELRWYENNNSCIDSAQIEVSFMETPNPSVMANKDTCGLSSPLIAYPHLDGGSWHTVSGPGNATIENSDSSSTTVSVDTAGIYKFAWIETNKNCSGSDTVTIQFFQQPVASFSPPPSLTCTPLEIEFENNSLYADTYYWDFNNGSTSNEKDPSQIFYNKSSIPVDYEISLITQTTNGCRDTATAVTTVAPSPISYFEVENQAGCSPVTSIFTNKSEGADTYEWNFNDGSSIENTENSSHTFTNSESYTLSPEIQLTVTNEYGCTDTSSQYVTIYPKQEFNLSATPDSACSPITVNFSATSGAFSYEWDFGTGSLISGTSEYKKVFTNETTDKVKDTITLYTTSAYGCLDTAQTVITTLPSPTTNFELNDVSSCSPKVVTFTNSTENISTSYWNFGDGTNLTSEGNEDIEHTFINSTYSPTDYNIRLITENSFGCKDSMDMSTTVYPIQEVNLTASPDSACSPVNISFIATQGANSYQWDFGDGNIVPGTYQQNKSFTNNSSDKQKLNITLYTTSIYGCTDTSQTNITILPSPTAYFEPNDFAVCSPKVVEFTNSSEGTSSSYWDFGDGTSSILDGSNNVEHTYTNTTNLPVDYVIKLITENDFGCKDSINGSTTVNPTQNFEFTATSDSSCSPVNVSFTATPGARSYQWDFGDGNLVSATYQYNKLFSNETSDKKDLTITLYATSAYGCTDTSQTNITILPSPTAYFEPNDFAVCSPKVVEFTNSSEGTSKSYWDFGDGTSSILEGSNNVEHTYTNTTNSPIDYSIKLITENDFGCKDSLIGSTSVNPRQNFDFTATPDSACSPVNVSFLATQGASSYQWDFGDGNLVSGTYIYNKQFSNGTFEKERRTITLYATSTYGCQDTAQQSITILPSPETYFEPNDFSVCSPKDVVFTNMTENITESYWNFGDETTAETEGNESIEHTYTNSTYRPLDYKIRLITKNAFGCVDSMDGYTSVNPMVEASIGETGKGCSPLQLSIGNSSTGATSFLWNFGEGNTSSDYMGVNSFSNNTTEDTTYNVSMIATSIYGCSDTAYTTATVYATPEVNFEVTPDYMQMPESTVSINNKTNGNNWNYEWNFGDDSSSSEAEPASHTYTSSGKYTISLKAYNEHCIDSTELNIEIIPSLPTVEYGPSTEGCPALTVDFYSETTEAETFLWEFGDGAISSEANPTHTYYTSGEYTVTLTVTGPGGQTIKGDVVINVFPQPTAYFEIYPKVVTIPDESVSFVNQSTGATDYLWDFGNGDTSEEANPVYEYTEPDTYNVSLDATNEYGCSDKYTVNEAVIAEEGGEISFPNAFTPNPTGPVSSEYTYGDNNNYVFYPAIQKGVEDYKMQIYTRWGQLIFESHDINIGWNGYYNGKMCAQGVYIWKVTCRFSTGDVKVYTGDVTLIR